MINLESIVTLFEQMSGKEIFINTFPVNKTEAIKFEIVSGAAELGGVTDCNIQFMCKSSHPSKSEAEALNLIKQFNNQTDKLFNTDKSQLILMQSTAQPFYVGETVTGEFLYAADFRILTCNI